MCTDQDADRVFERGGDGSSHVFGQLSGDPLEVSIDKGRHESLFAWKILIEGSDVDTRNLRDPVRARAFVSLLSKNSRGGLEQGFDGRSRALLLWRLLGLRSWLAL
jgi:hypothetical protein